MSTSGEGKVDLSAAAFSLSPAEFQGADADVRSAQLIAAALSSVYGNSWHGGAAILDVSTPSKPTIAARLDTTSGVNCSTWIAAGATLSEGVVRSGSGSGAGSSDGGASTAFSGARVLLGLDSGDLALWDPSRPSGDSLGSAALPQVHQGNIVGTASIAGGAHAASASSDGSVVLWDIATLQCTAQLAGHAHGSEVTFAAAIDHDDLLVTGDLRGDVFAWDARGRQQGHVAHWSTAAPRNSAATAALTSEYPALSCAPALHGGSLRGTATPLAGPRRFERVGGATAGCSGGGSRFAVGTESGHVVFADARQPNAVAGVASVSKSSIETVAWTGGQRFAAGGVGCSVAVVDWAAENGTEVIADLGFEVSAVSAVPGSNGTRIAVALRDGSVAVTEAL